jgi:general secretion pathway protein G
MSITKQKSTRRIRGFTLIELIVVVFIIGLLAALVVPRMIHRTDEAKVTAARIQIRNFETALRSFRADNGFYPSTEQGLHALVEPPDTGRIPEHYRRGGYTGKREVPLDPWGNEFVYMSPATAGDYEIICYGADGLPGGKGIDADISSIDVD